MKTITVLELKALQDEGADVCVIDVREPYEYDIVNIGGTLLPMNEVLERETEIPRDKQVIVHCRSGKRSASVVDALERIHKFNNLYTLEGGVLAWVAQIDPSLPSY